MTTNTTTPPGTDSGLPPLDVGVRCPDCDYDLRGSTSARCSECGFDLHLLRTQESQIPWVHRARLGRGRAYWRTVAYVIFRPRRFAIELNRPVSQRAARRFWLVTWLHVVATLAACLAIAEWLYPWWLGKPLPDGWLGFTRLAALWLTVALGPAPFVAAQSLRSARLTEEQEERVAALSLYAWASWALAPLAGVFVAVATFVARARTNVDLLFCTLALVAPMLIALCFEPPHRALMRHAFGISAWGNFRDWLRLGSGLLLWVLLSFLVPVGGLYVWYILESLRGL